MADPVVTPGVTDNTNVTNLTAPETPWYQGKVDDATVGYWQNKGWDAKDPHALTLALTKSYQEAERYVGAPPAELLRMPKPGDEPGQRQFWERLGAPSDPNGYDLSGLKFTNGDVLEPEFQEFFRAQAHALHLPKEAATGMAQSMMKFMEQTEQRETVASDFALQAEHQSLRANWGQNYDTNLIVAREGAQKLGITPDIVDALEKVAGYSKTMEMFRKLGAGMGEDTFIRSNQQGGSGVKTAGEAEARLTELKADKGFVERYMKGDILARREMDQLHQVIAAQREAQMR